MTVDNTREIQRSDGVIVDATTRGSIQLMQFARTNKHGPDCIELTTRDARQVAAWLIELADEIEASDA